MYGLSPDPDAVSRAMALVRGYADGGVPDDAPVSPVDAGLKAAQDAAPWPVMNDGAGGMAIPGDPSGDAIAKWAKQRLGGLWDAATLPGDVYAGKTDPNSDEGFARAQALAGYATGSGAAVPAEADALNMGIRAYHGSPHDFDRFDMSKIGTGEGAQAYGHGLYFADNEGVARSYRNSLAGDGTEIYLNGTRYDDLPEPMQQAALSFDTGRAPEKHIALLESRAKLNPEMWQSELDAYRHLIGGIGDGSMRLERRPLGHMYEADLGVDPDKLLNYDAPVPASHPVRGMLHDLASYGVNAEFPSQRNAAKDVYLGAHNENLTGQGAYNSLIRVIDPARDQLKASLGERALFGSPSALASEILNQQGIPGIRYLDAGSRFGDGTGTRNYVMFDDKPISILRKYGDGGPVSNPVPYFARAF